MDCLNIRKSRNSQHCHLNWATVIHEYYLYYLIHLSSTEADFEKVAEVGFANGGASLFSNTFTVFVRTQKHMWIMNHCLFPFSLSSIALRRGGSSLMAKVFECVLMDECCRSLYRPNLFRERSISLAWRLLFSD